MTTATTRRSSMTTGLVLVVLGTCAAARAAPPETFSAMRGWDPRPSHVLALEAPPAAPAQGSTRRVAPRRMQPKFSAMDEFREAYLTPRMRAQFPHENTVATVDLTNPLSNPVMTDPAAVDLVQKRAIRAMTGALKRYAIESLGIDRWSLRIAGPGGRDRTAPGDDSRAVRFRVGFSQLAPRADLVIPVTSGRVVVSADARGHMRTTFERSASRLTFAADFYVPDHTATVRLNMQF
jgi:hypothetical protein